jgi:hypothetical protein
VRHSHNTNSKQLKGNMQDKTKKQKKAKKEIKVHDLKPAKEVKGGSPSFHRKHGVNQ